MHLIALIDQYGYIVLYLALMLELIAFPLPGEVLMSYAGFLVFKGELGWLQSIIAAAAGASTGITISYFVGYKLGIPFFIRYGKYFHLDSKKLEKTSTWFQKHGNKMLLFAFFIPGVRHMTGYFSGTTRISFRRFSVYAYIGALFWTTTFIFLGKLLGPQWEQFHNSVKNYFLIGSLIAGLILVMVYLYKDNKLKLTENILALLAKGLEIFHSMGRVKVLVAGVAVAFLGLTLLMFGLIQDYLGNEFGQFDKTVVFLTHMIFGKDWDSWMSLFNIFVSNQALATVIILTFVWIFFKGENRGLEIVFFLVVIAGGKLVNVGLISIFHRLGPDHVISFNNIINPFPSGETLMVVTTYGFFAYLFLRHTKNAMLRTIAPSVTALISILVGLSRVYQYLQNPSDVVSGYVFGGVWLTLSIILLEVFRVLNKGN